jgi:hypothetical protein
LDETKASGKANGTRRFRIAAFTARDGWAHALAFVDRAYDASPAIATVPIAAVDHLVEPEDGGFRRFHSVSVDHRSGKKLDLGLAGRHALYSARAFRCPSSTGSIKPHATTE